jgi:magnesium chelatase family protein
VLFLDELAEFPRPALEALRQPLEEGSIRITRAQRSVTFPARFMLVGATNPCPCGHLGDPRGSCSCPEPSLRRYRAKLSGPLLDRIDMIVRVESPTREELMSAPGPPQSAEMRARVAAARFRQIERLASTNARCNGELGPSQLRLVSRLEPAARAALYGALDRLRLSVRGHDRVLRVARTLADLEGRDPITRGDIAQAVAYREHHVSELLAAVV